MDLLPEVQQAYKELIPYCGSVEDLLQKSEEFILSRVSQYNGTPISQEELECKAIIDHLHTDNPTWGARQMSS